MINRKKLLLFGKDRLPISSEIYGDSYIVIKRTTSGSCTLFRNVNTTYTIPQGEFMSALIFVPNPTKHPELQTITLNGRMASVRSGAIFSYFGAKQNTNPFSIVKNNDNPDLTLQYIRNIENNIDYSSDPILPFDTWLEFGYTTNISYTVNNNEGFQVPTIVSGTEFKYYLRGFMFGNSNIVKISDTIGNSVTSSSGKIYNWATAIPGYTIEKVDLKTKPSS